MSPDANAPTWDNMINGQLNLYDAIRKQVDFKQGEKDYKLRTDRVLHTLICRAPGWHMVLLPFSTSASTSSTMQRSSASEAQDPTSTCQRWNRILKLDSGTTFLTWLKTTSV